ncbi:MAG: hypothetical protein AAF975_09710, partial [Spirochaetota bacterium]
VTVSRFGWKVLGAANFKEMNEGKGRLAALLFFQVWHYGKEYRWRKLFHTQFDLGFHLDMNEKNMGEFSVKWQALWQLPKHWSIGLSFRLAKQRPGKPLQALRLELRLRYEFRSRVVQTSTAEVSENPLKELDQSFELSPKAGGGL